MMPSVPSAPMNRLLEIVAGVVLLELVEHVEHAPVGEHHLEAEHEVARHPVGERAGAARIGREIAADGAAALGAERERKQPVGVGRGLLRLHQHDARLAGHGVRRGVDLADAVEPGERDQELAVVRDLPADQPGIAALRHDRRAGLVGEPQDRGDLGDRARPQDRGRRAAIEIAALDQVFLLLGRIGDGVFFADQRDEARQQVGGDARGLVRDIHERLVMTRRPPAGHAPTVGRRRNMRRFSFAHKGSAAPGTRAYARGAAARARRSLIASPKPSCGIGITAMRSFPHTY